MLFAQTTQRTIAADEALEADMKSPLPFIYDPEGTLSCTRM